MYLLLLRLNREVSSLTPHLNFPICFLLQSSSVYCLHYHHILVFFSPQFYSLLSCSYNYWLNIQTSHNYNSSYYSYPPPWHMGCVMIQDLKCQVKKQLLYLSNTRELDRVPSTEWSTLYTNLHGPC